ncbi:aminopeptidase P N-terminal domain-containing protein [Caldimonas tepidiphila]|uniref:aminopeptidase P N-terminal domain-containing protein n=1 Tax=Caldimonas tepidiphila TaxID=2315841 RepID=UPI000E5BF26F|nr:aminopeptidase P N-terminal domain-containing protein [Caldimonas tepidiphila]
MTDSPHAARRARVARALQAGRGLALVPTAPETLRNGDAHHPYRFDSHFWYLSGFAEPEAWLAISHTGRCELFCRAQDPAHEIWDGARLGLQAAPAALGVDAAHDVRTLDELLPKLLAEHDSVWFPFGLHEGLAARVEGWLAKLRQRERSGARAPAALHDLRPLLDEMRLVKDEAEIALMRRAGEISAAAHVRAMQACRPGLREYQLEAELLHAFRWAGAAGPAYPSIVAAGANACVLHHPAGDAELRAGELCLIDAGAEFQGYAGDITRTFPVDGRFSAPQRELYALVLAAQQAAIGQTRPGARKIDAHWAAVRVLSQGLLDLGLLSAERHGGVDDVIESAAYRAFYMHGTGHWLGLDVHDVGEVLQRDEPAVEQPDGNGGRVVRAPSRVLQPGMVVTIEPGLYVRPSAEVPERFWNIGIRIEDDALVTPAGCELLTRGVPVAPDEIEALMRG